MKRLLILILTIAAMTTAVFGDWKLSQKTKIRGEEIGRTSTIYQKGVRQRREEKMDLGKDAEDPEFAAMMAQMGQSMPAMPTHVSQCDLKQDLLINEKNRTFFIDYYDWSALPAEKVQRRPNQKMVVKGTLTMDTVVSDSGRRQQMFGLPARWLKVVQTIEESADSCNGYSLTKIEHEGWFVTLSLESESCPIRQMPSSESGGAGGGCRSRTVVKRAQSYGTMLTGTMRMYEGTKVGAEFEIETIELSKAPLDAALFDIPKGFSEVDSQADLSNKRSSADTPAKNASSNPSIATAGKVKTIAIDLLSGNSSKVDPDNVRAYIAGKATAAGMSGFPINARSELASGTFAYVIGVEIGKIKESGASKIGGMFGKVTGTAGAAKAGNSSAEIVVTLYGSDGRTVVATAPGRAEVPGKANDAVMAAIDQVIDGLLNKIR